jgi:Tfp pilus assembly protein PilF
VLGLARVGTQEQVTTAFATALERWPENLAAAVGLANQFHARGALARATEVLREARRRHPGSAIVANNLAQVLSDQGQQREALALIDQAAADSSNPFASEIRSTREAIVERIKRNGGTAR